MSAMAYHADMAYECYGVSGRYGVSVLWRIRLIWRISAKVTECAGDGTMLLLKWCLVSLLLWCLVSLMRLVLFCLFNARLDSVKQETYKTRDM